MTPIIRQSFLILALTSLAGCAIDYAAEPDFGQSIRQTIQAQAINPKGVGHTRIEPGLEGSSAKATVDQYIKSYEQPQGVGNVFRLGVGGQSMQSGTGSQ